MEFLDYVKGFKSYSLNRQKHRQIDRQTHRQTDTTENITYPHTRVVTITNEASAIAVYWEPSLNSTELQSL